MFNCHNVLHVEHHYESRTFLMYISSNISEVIKTVLNFFFFFYKKISHAPTSTKNHKKTPKAAKAQKAQKLQKRNRAKAQKRK